MGRCKTILTTIVVVICLFGFVPIRIAPPNTAFNSTETNLLFSSYVEKFNKPYRNNETLRLRKLSGFKVIYTLHIILMFTDYVFFSRIQ